MNPEQIKYREVKSFQNFLAEDSLKRSRFLKVPLSLLFDKRLTPGEKIFWMTLASFAYTSSTEIFPSRKLLAALLGLKYETSISKITSSLQKKSRLSKFYKKDTTFYYPSFSTEPEDMNFKEDLMKMLGEELKRPSPRNTILYKSAKRDENDTDQF